MSQLTDAIARFKADDYGSRFCVDHHPGGDATTIATAVTDQTPTTPEWLASIGWVGWERNGGKNWVSILSPESVGDHPKTRIEYQPQLGRYAWTFESGREVPPLETRGQVIAACLAFCIPVEEKKGDA